MNNEQRERFEKWAIGYFKHDVSKCWIAPLSEYRFPNVQAAYDAWQIVEASQSEWVSGFKLFSEVGFPPADTEVICGWFGVDDSELDYMTHDEDLNPYWANSKDGYDFWARKPKPPKEQVT